jgi:hypothetical protein
MDLAKHQRRPRLELKLRHHPDNLHALYRESEDPVERSRWHAIWLRFGAPAPQMIPFYANAFVLGHQWNRVCRLRVSGSWARTRHRSATTSIISSRS